MCNVVKHMTVPTEGVTGPSMPSIVILLAPPTRINGTRGNGRARGSGKGRGKTRGIAFYPSFSRFSFPSTASATSRTGIRHVWD